MSHPPLEQCLLCQAPATYLEHLEQSYFCNCCGQTFQVNEAGAIMRRNPTQHVNDRRQPQIDVKGHVMDEE